MKIHHGYMNQIAPEIFKQNLMLRYYIYLQEGFIPSNDSHIDTDQFDEQAYHSIGVDQGNVIGSVRLLTKQLALDEIFNKEKQQLMGKYQAKNPAEMSRLVVDPSYRSKKLQHQNHRISLLISFKCVQIALEQLHIDILLNVVHPRYLAMYQSFGFTPYSLDQKPCPYVKNNPGILIYATLDKLNKRLNEGYEQGYL